MNLETHPNHDRRTQNFIKILRLYRNTQKLKKGVVKILADDRNKERLHREKMQLLRQKLKKPNLKFYIVCVSLSLIALSSTFALYAIDAEISAFEMGQKPIKNDTVTAVDPPPKASIDPTESTLQEEEEFEEPIEGIYDYSNCSCYHRYHDTENKRVVCKGCKMMKRDK